jgi:hypothetical protein
MVSIIFLFDPILALVPILFQDQQRTTTTAATTTIQGTWCTGCGDESCWSNYDGITTCSGYEWDQVIAKSTATYLSAPLLTHARHHLDFTFNGLLTRLDLPVITAVGGYFGVAYNPILTYLYTPLLTALGSELIICENNHAFVIPSAPPNGPVGGFVTSDPYKGTENCIYLHGNASCSISPLMSCP